MKQRHISDEFLEKLQKEFVQVLDIVRNDATLDIEFRGDSIIIYYRGGKIIELKENGELSPMDKQYGLVTSSLSIKNIVNYCNEAKHHINVYQELNKCNLGEKEISQRIVMENNYSPYSYDTDYFIIDMEYNDSNGNQFDLVALNWPSTSQAHKTRKCKIAIIETKQGMLSLKTSKENPGIKRHYEDFNKFISSKEIEDFKADMMMIFRQKCMLKLIKGINDSPKALKVDGNTNFILNHEIEFIAILANYKKASEQLINELKELPKDNKCRFATSSFMGYGLFDSDMFDYNQFINRYNLITI